MTVAIDLSLADQRRSIHKRVRIPRPVRAVGVGSGGPRTASAIEPATEIAANATIARNNTRPKSIVFCGFAGSADFRTQ